MAELVSREEAQDALRETPARYHERRRDLATIVALYAQLEAQAPVVATAKAFYHYMQDDTTDEESEMRLLMAVRALEEAERESS